MTTTTVARPRAAVPLAVAAAALVAGLIQGDAVAAASGDPARSMPAGLAAALPVAVVFAVWARYRQPGAGLGALGLVLFSTALLATTRWPGSPPPLWLAEGVVLGLGVALAGLRRVRPAAILDGVILAYASAAFIFEVGIPLAHAA